MIMKLTDIVKKGSAIGAMALASALPMKAQTQFNFSADQSGTVTKPVYGLAATDSDYLLSGSVETDSLPLNFNGNNQQTYAFDNPTTLKDAASFNNDYFFGLSDGGTIGKISTSDGKFNLSFGSIELGSNTFGIGYDASTNRIGAGQFNSATNQMQFFQYDATNGSLVSSSDLFSFNPLQYGTPTGLDFVVKGGAERVLVGTRDKFDDGENLNFILDMDFDSGTVGQYGTIAGNTNKLQDVHYLDGKLAVAFQSGSSGRMEVGNFAPIPEPKHVALGLGALALGAAAYGRRRSKNQTSTPEYK